MLTFKVKVIDKLLNKQRNKLHFLNLISHFSKLFFDFR